MDHADLLEAITLDVLRLTLDATTPASTRRRLIRSLPHLCAAIEELLAGEGEREEAARAGSPTM
ncbi:MAG: hypothetical protein KGK07_13405 [Chloroflexota bacterium]|nr:hypothetical protein [Chloroflexota bacterium]